MLNFASHVSYRFITKFHLQPMKCSILRTLISTQPETCLLSVEREINFLKLKHGNSLKFRIQRQNLHEFAELKFSRIKVSRY